MTDKVWIVLATSGTGNEVTTTVARVFLSEPPAKAYAAVAKNNERAAYGYALVSYEIVPCDVEAPDV